MDDYLDDLALHERTPRTIMQYRRVLYAFADRFHIDTRTSDLKALDVRTYLCCAPGTQNTKAQREAVIRCWLEWCALTGRLEQDPLEGDPRIKRTIRKGAAQLEAEEHARMLRMERVRTLSWRTPPTTVR